MPGGSRVGRITLVVLAGAIFGIGLSGGLGQASLYSPDDRNFVVPVAADGHAQALSPDDFRGALAVLTNIRDERRASERQPFLKRIESAKEKKLSASETAGVAALLLRVGRLEEAVNLLAPRLRDRNPDYFVYTTYAAIRASAGDWSEALRYHTAAQLDSAMPPTVRGLNQSQRDWWEKLDRDYVPHYYRLRHQESEERKNKGRAELEKLDEAEVILPLFPVPNRANANPSPVRFVNDAGNYEPGRLAATERAKLPPDAIPIVQQLLLWFPTDNRLYWLLAELYAANGNFSAAFNAFHSISWGRAYGNRKLFMDHRQAVESALKTQPQAKGSDDIALAAPTSGNPPADHPTSPADNQPISMRTIGIYFGAVAVVVFIAIVRAVSRRTRGNCRPLG